MTLARSRPHREGEQAREQERATYARDFHTWTQEQGALLRAGRLDAIDRENLAEEIESLGRNEFDKLVSFYRLILLHMLKWEHQPKLRGRSWSGSIDLRRAHAENVLADNPGLKSRLDEAFERAYRLARLEAVRETGFSKRAFPETCPFTRDEMLNCPYPLD